jgi:hypothetical protein
MEPKQRRSDCPIVLKSGEMTVVADDKPPERSSFQK